MHRYPNMRTEDLRAHTHMKKHTMEHSMAARSPHMLSTFAKSAHSMHVHASIDNLSTFDSSAHPAHAYSSIHNPSNLMPCVAGKQHLFTRALEMGAYAH
mmetsp:Transcript_19815/g.43103  ORF Transcript_19815/g.43103 Transcript_19815/m.43103 type:complete len:99 (+) Transcript_19815:451-747(+)